MEEEIWRTLSFILMIFCIIGWGLAYRGLKKRTKKIEKPINPPKRK